MTCGLFSVAWYLVHILFMFVNQAALVAAVGSSSNTYVHRSRKRVPVRKEDAVRVFRRNWEIQYIYKILSETLCVYEVLLIVFF